MRTAVAVVGIAVILAGCSLFFLGDDEAPRKAAGPVTVSPGPEASAHRHCLFGCPADSAASNDLISRDAYTLSSNDETKFADWVAYRVAADTMGQSGSRNWKADVDIAEAETLEPDDYKRAHAELHTDRGHQAPLASLSAFDGGASTNFLSNITPQKSELNQGPWNQLEAAERRLIEGGKVQEIRVQTGTLYERGMPELPEADEPHRIPSGYWKVVAVLSTEGLQTVAFVMDQETPRGDDFCDHQATIDTIEERSGLNLFPLAADDSFEAELGPLALDLGCPSRVVGTTNAEPPS